jgi:hypothetical protein
MSQSSISVIFSVYVNVVWGFNVPTKMAFLDVTQRVSEVESNVYDFK